MSCQQGCGCDPGNVAEPSVWNPPGQSAIDWRTSPHSQVVARLRARLGAPEVAPEIRALAGNGVEDPAVALLDGFGLVADTVSFYTERIAQEGFLRTATELGSLRMLARSIGYELRPGVAAEAELAFDVEEAPGAPRTVDIAAGTPIQSIPGPDELPQTFEVSEDLHADVAWNAVAGAASLPADPVVAAGELWLAGTALGLRTGDPVLLVPTGESPAARWELAVVLEVSEPDTPAAGWTRVVLEQRDSWRHGAPLGFADGVGVLTFGRRAGLFGAQAADPTLLVKDGNPPPGTSEIGTTGRYEWDGIDDPRPDSGSDRVVKNVIEVDGDQARIVAGSWIVLQQAGSVHASQVSAVAPSGQVRFAVSGKLLRVSVTAADGDDPLAAFGRRSTVVHCEPRTLPAGHRPVTGALPADSDRRVLRLVATFPPLPLGRQVMVTGYPLGQLPTDPITARATPPPLAEPATVAACVVDAGVMTVTFEQPLTGSYDPAGVRVRGNVVEATHGETVEQVLGSGDATQTFQRLVTRRGPLTHVRASTPSGTRSTLRVRVDGVAWDLLDSLDGVGPTERALAARDNDDGTQSVTGGDGMSTGPRLPTGAENVRAVYRVGIGAPGALLAGQLARLPRRPTGIRAVSNPAPTHDWAPPESLAEARRNAPLRTRTLDRVVSVADHGDFAAGFAGVSLARADAVWDGHATMVVVSVLGTAGGAVGDGLRTDLADALEALRAPGTRFELLAGAVLRFGVAVDLAIDPAFPRAQVEQAVRTALVADFAAPVVPFATAVTAARVLVTVKAVPGVVACTMPMVAEVVSPLGAPLELGPAAPDLIAPLPARWLPGPPARPAAAEVAGLVDEAVRIGVMTR